MVRSRSASSAPIWQARHMRIVQLIIGSLVIFGLGVVAGSYVTDAHAREQRQQTKRSVPEAGKRIVDTTYYKLKMLDEKLDALDKRLRDNALLNSNGRNSHFAKLTKHIDMRFRENLGYPYPIPGMTRQKLQTHQPKGFQAPWWALQIMARIDKRCR